MMLFADNHMAKKKKDEERKTTKLVCRVDTRHFSSSFTLSPLVRQRLGRNTNAMGKDEASEKKKKRLDSLK